LVAMADIGDHRAAGAVDIAPSIRIPDVDAARLADERPALARLVEEVRRCSRSLDGHGHASAATSAQSRPRTTACTVSPWRNGRSSIGFSACMLRPLTVTKYRAAWP